jgi:hypothetical protein
MGELLPAVTSQVIVAATSTGYPVARRPHRPPGPHRRLHRPPGPHRRARRLPVRIAAPEDQPPDARTDADPGPNPPSPEVFSSGVVDVNTGHPVIASRCRRSDPPRLPPRRRIACPHGNGKRAAQPGLPPPSGGRPHGDLGATERLRPAVRGQVCTPHNVVGEIRPLRPDVKNARNGEERCVTDGGRRPPSQSPPSPLRPVVARGAVAVQVPRGDPRVRGRQRPVRRAS